jgi:acetyl/propionyl-CoA carboxylase alpha subunit
MAWGETREESVKQLLRALLTFRLSGVKCNVPLLRDVLSNKEFLEASHHTGSLPVYMEQRKLRHKTNGATNGHDNGHMNGNGHEKNNREIAAAIGAAMALAIQGSQAAAPAAPAVNSWRVYGRREQLLSRTLGNRGWR